MDGLISGGGLKVGFYSNFMIVKHEFGYFKTFICFRTEATSH